MATEIFTTWQDLYDLMLDSLAAGEVLAKEVRKGDTWLIFRSLEDIQKWLDFVKRQVDREKAISGASGAVVARTLASPGYQ